MPAVIPQTDVSVPSMAFRTERKKVFIVHGHDGQLKYEVARLVDELGFESIIFHEQPNNGRAIFQKLTELTATVDYAVVLYTACDTGKSVGASQERPRARQNVVFEHGYLLARLGTNKVAAIKEAEVEKPSDLDGFLYISVDDNWKYQLSRELKSLS
ncbi:putative nucleotide-binding protein containing TIR-like domain protein [compost metagenome]